MLQRIGTDAVPDSRALLDRSDPKLHITTGRACVLRPRREMRPANHTRSAQTWPNPANSAVQVAGLMYYFKMVRTPPPSVMEAHVMSDRWLSVEEIAEYLGVSKDTVYAWISKRNMPAHRIGRLWKFKTDEVDEWVRSGGAADAEGKGKE